MRQVLLVYELARAFDGQTYAQVVNHHWQRLRELTADEAIAARIGAQFDPLKDPQSELYVTSQSIGEGTMRAFDFFNAANPHSQYSSHAHAGSHMLKLSYPRDLGLSRFDAEFRLSLIAHVIRWFSEGLEVHAVKGVKFRASRPANHRELNRVLGCPVEFDQSVDAVIVDPDIMHARVWGSDRIRLKFGRLVGAAIAETKGSGARLCERVALAVQSGLERGDGGIKWLASQFRMSPRTLQRRLADEGSHYSHIVDQARMLLCLQLMGTPGLKMADIAKRLGYSSESNFKHAFHRWFGDSPNLYRLMSGRGKSITKRAS